MVNFSGQNSADLQGFNSAKNLCASPELRRHSMEKTEVSTQLAAANQRLLQKRARFLADKHSNLSDASSALAASACAEIFPANLPWEPEQAGGCSWSLRNAQAALLRLRQPAPSLPSVTGQVAPNDCLKFTVIPLETTAAPAINRQPKTQPGAPGGSGGSAHCLTAANLESSPQLDWPVHIAPTLAGFMLDLNNRRHGAPLFGPYRLYSALRGLDQAGRGWLDYHAVKAQLTRKNEVCYLYGPRRFKEVLRQGEGLFWHRVKANGAVRIRLVARYKIAQHTCGRLQGREVVVTLRDLVGTGAGQETSVKAALYAAIQTGLRAEPWQICRDKKAMVTGCSHYRQRAYEQRAGIGVQRNIQVIGLYSHERLIEAMFAGVDPVQSNVVYKHIDKKGVIDPHRPGASYVVRLLPNTYRLPDGMFSVVMSRRQRAMNRQMADLCIMSDGGSRVEPIVRVFHDNARQAFAAQEKHPDNLALFPIRTGVRVGLWRAAFSF